MFDRDEHELKRLEEELRSGRPEPRAEFLADLVSRIETPAPTRRRITGFRLGFAVAFAALFLVAGAALGAFGYAGSSARDAVKQTAGVVSDVVKPGGGRRSTPQPSQAELADLPAGAAGAGTAFAGSGPSISTKSGHDQYKKFVIVCLRVHHKQVTIPIPRILIPFFEPWIVNFGPCGNGHK
jgi:hypothetical protein